MVKTFNERPNCFSTGKCYERMIKSPIPQRVAMYYSDAKLLDAKLLKPHNCEFITTKFETS